MDDPLGLYGRAVVPPWAAPFGLHPPFPGASFDEYLDPRSTFYRPDVAVGLRGELTSYPRVERTVEPRTFTDSSEANSGSSETNAPRTEASSHDQWEYARLTWDKTAHHLEVSGPKKRYSGRVDDPLRVLNYLGDNGWEAIAEASGRSDAARHEWTLKRRGPSRKLTEWSLKMMFGLAETTERTGALGR